MTGFLDIDGVLVPYSNKKLKKSSDGYPLFSQEAVHYLNELNSIYPNINWVISSTWRAWGIDVLKQLFKTRGLLINLIGVTPLPEETILFYNRDPRYMIRGHEIELYCLNNEIKEWFIIDDKTDFLEEQLHYLIQTDSYKGFVKKDFEKLLNLLK
jgi:hypothetical protein